MFRKRLARSKTFNPFREVNSPRLWAHFYHALLNQNWPIFLGLTAFLYLLINLFFAWIYWSFSDYGLQGSLTYSPFFSSFLLSVQTLTTVGYGTYSPTTLEGHWIMMIESWVGFLFIAILTGSVFARLSIPQAHLLFSDCILINQDDTHERRYLSMRVANARGTDLIDTTAELTFIDLSAKPTFRNIIKVHSLELVRKKTANLFLNWVILHEITPESPLYKMTSEDFTNLSRFYLTIRGYDATYHTEICIQKIYSGETVRFNLEFVDMIEQVDSQIKVHYERISETTPNSSF